MAETKRSGDKIFIEGDYQQRALHEGIIFQRSWHRLKLISATQSLAGNLHPTILDIGCGSGTLLQFVQAGYQGFTGVDVNQEAIKFCRERYPAPENQFRLLEFDDLGQLEGEQFSHIFFLESIEHIAKEQGLQLLKNAKPLLAAEGVMVLTTPNRKSAWPFIEKALDFFRLTPTLAHEQHEHLYSMAELTALAWDAGFSVKKAFTMNGIAPWLSFLGTGITNAIHRWESNQHWLPGSIMVMELAPKPNP
jgi:2-polyprenyl-3-methyl-5-hydroxy-6-metoxy-1,4-benzoquinol methylase